MTAKSAPCDWKEARRFRAATLNTEGWEQQEIAEALGVTKGAVSQWMKAAAAGGLEALSARPHTGGPAKLTAAEQTLIPELLSHGAEAYGFRGEVWTCARVAQVIHWELGVQYHRAHVSRLLKELAWTPQKPVTRAAQRDEARITQWRAETWCELKKRRGWNIGHWFLLMNRASISCLRSRGLMRHAVKRRC